MTPLARARLAMSDSMPRSDIEDLVPGEGAGSLSPVHGEGTQGPVEIRHDDQGSLTGSSRSSLLRRSSRWPTRSSWNGPTAPPDIGPQSIAVVAAVGRASMSALRLVVTCSGGGVAADAAIAARKRPATILLTCSWQAKEGCSAPRVSVDGLMGVQSLVAVP